MRRQHDPVTAPDALHGRTDGLDGPQPLVTQHHAGCRAGTALVHMKIGTAQRAGGDPDHHIVIPLDPGIFDILDNDIARRPEHDSLHQCPLACPVPGLSAGASGRDTDPAPVTSVPPGRK